MRGKKAVINTLWSLIEQVVTVAAGFILPRLILSAYGSVYNGLITSMTQFLACAVLLRSGIGGVTRVALYKPLAFGDNEKLSAIVKATDNFMKRVGIILLIAIIAFAAIYPFLIHDELGWLFTFTLFLIVGASTFAESFWGITYLIVLQADQQLWVVSALKCICSILNTAVGACLILRGFSIHFVKLSSALVYVAYPIIQSIYVKRHYKINTKAKPDNKALSQRWDAFWQQVAVFVMNNTDVMVLTVFMNMSEVSVYSIYYMVVNGLNRAITAITNGLESAFGNMIAKHEKRALITGFSVVETIIYTVSTILYTCAGLLIVDFISVYTTDISDANYIRPMFAFIIVLAQFFNAIRMPYQLVVQAAGHYKQTKNGAILEPIINIFISVVCVIKVGLVGVAVGTLFATVFRTVQYCTYAYRNIIKQNYWSAIYRITLSLAECCCTVLLSNLLPLSTPLTYFQWAKNASCILFISATVTIAGNSIFFKKDTIELLKKLNAVWTVK